jgi:hypothetical protein
VVSFVLRPVYPWGKSCRNPLNRRLGELPVLDMVEKRKVFFPFRESNLDSSVA